MSEHPDRPIDELRDLLRDVPGLEERLTRSLRLAHDRAAADLRPALLDALEWPRDPDAYARYLRGFVRWIPQQSGAQAWKNADAPGGQAREVADRVAHFFWLVDQPEDDEDRTGILEGDDRFGAWLTAFAAEWGSFLDTPESFDDGILASFREHAPEYEVEDSMVDGRPNAPSGWRTFNQFFARQLNTGLRPISAPEDNRVVVAPADSSFQGHYGIREDSGIPATRIKGTHEYGNVAQLLEGSRHAEAFAGGTFVHYMLPPWAYHRFHLPVGGRVDESFVVQGTVYAQVELVDGELEALDSARSGYEFRQTRGVVTVDTAGSPAGDLGIVGVVAVGMAHVASVVLTTVPGTDVAKGAEFGHFQFGGSDIVILLGPDVEAEVDTSDVFRRVGTPAVACRTGGLPG